MLIYALLYFTMPSLIKCKKQKQINLYYLYECGYGTEPVNKNFKEEGWRCHQCYFRVANLTRDGTGIKPTCY